MQFTKGYIPWNKGKHTENSGQFKKGVPRAKSAGMKKGHKRGQQSEEHKLKNRLGHLGKKCSLETIRKMKASHPKGDKSPYWIKDRTQIKSNKDRHWGSSKYTEWRTSVFKRDGYKCKISNKECGDYVQAHHILSWRDYPELRYKLNNGITLCLAHHPRKRSEEKRLASEFQRLVSVSKDNLFQD